VEREEEGWEEEGEEEEVPWDAEIRWAAWWLIHMPLELEHEPRAAALAILAILWAAAVLARRCR
jgi:hypothetical protein